MITRLVLWDIDGTLVNSNGVGSKAISLAFRRMRGHDPDTSGYSYAGKTDPQIFYDLLSRHDVDERTAETLVPDGLKYLADALADLKDELRQRNEPLPGVRPILEAIAARGIAQSLLTGNIEPNAVVKLATLDFDLTGFFNWSLGAFGSDDRFRNNLVSVALTKARRNGFDFQPAEITVIGDTPLDIACGKAGGARTVAIANAKYSVADLAHFAPDVVLPDYLDVNVVVKALLNL